MLRASIEQVLALPRSSQCSTPGQLSIDLHLLRRAEALLVLEAVLGALARGSNALFSRLPCRRQNHHPEDAVSDGRRGYVDEAEQVSPETVTSDGAEAPDGSGARGACCRDSEPRRRRDLYAERFTSLEVVVGRGAHSVAGVPRLRPCVAGYLASKRLQAEAVEGDRGKGVVVVRLGNL